MLGHHGNLPGTVLARRQNPFGSRRQAVVPLVVLGCPHLRQEVLVPVLVEDELRGRLAGGASDTTTGIQAFALPSSLWKKIN